jgi:hypothetical protein
MTSGLPREADIAEHGCRFRFVPIVLQNSQKALRLIFR